MPEEQLISPTFFPASDCSLLVKFGDIIFDEGQARVFELTRALLDQPLASIHTIHPAYSSVLISFDPLAINHSDVTKWVRKLLRKSNSLKETPKRTMEIPVCYGNHFGPDLHAVAEHCNITVDEVVQIHSSRDYLVYFLGFSPGFPYLGGMSETIAVRRLSTPRTSVPAGSVAIGGNQTGIYPIESPGGWKIIGRTPLRLFDVQKNPPTLLQMSDRVRFIPITSDAFDALAGTL